MHEYFVLTGLHGLILAYRDMTRDARLAADVELSRYSNMPEYALICPLKEYRSSGRGTCAHVTGLDGGTVNVQEDFKSFPVPDNEPTVVCGHYLYEKDQIVMRYMNKETTVGFSSLVLGNREVSAYEDKVARLLRLPCFPD